MSHGDSAAIPKGANLVLCEYARVANGGVDIVGGGLLIRPDEGDKWYLAGVVDLDAEDLAQGGSVYVKNLTAGAKVEGSEGNLHGLDVADEGLVRVPVAIEVPDFRTLEPGAYAIVFKVGTVETQVPFLVAPPEPDTTQGEDSHYEADD